MLYIQSRSYNDASLRKLGFKQKGKPIKHNLHTNLQEDVLQLIARGHSNGEIAEQLETDVETVAAQKSAAMKALGLCSRIDIIRYAMEQGWVK